jgi:hypothetical protein
VDNPDTIQGASTPARATRRTLLRALGIGGAVAAVSVAARPASAQDATTTTSPPLAPTQSDRPLLGALKVAELSAVEAYSVLTPERLAALGYDAPTTEVLSVLGVHHRSYAESLNALYGPGAPMQTSDKVLSAMNAAALATGDAATVLATAQAIEELLVDTHLVAIENTQSVEMAALLASILPVEARHATVLAHLQGQPYDSSAPAEEDGADALPAAEIL